MHTLFQVYTATSGIDDYETYVREEQQISAEEEVPSFSPLLLYSSLELSDTQVYEP